MKVFVVGVSDAECSSIVSIHRTYEGALKSWNNKRLELLKEARQMKFWGISRGWDHEYDSRYNSHIVSLSCEDPTLINNWPHDTPYITEYEVLE